MPPPSSGGDGALSMSADERRAVAQLVEVTGTPTETAIAPYPQQADTWYTSYSVTLASDAPAGSQPILVTGSQRTQTSRATLTVTIT